MTTEDRWQNFELWISNLAWELRNEKYRWPFTVYDFNGAKGLIQVNNRQSPLYYRRFCA